MGAHNHPELTMHTFPLAQYIEHFAKGEWAEVADLMLGSTRKVARAGAELAICPDNTIHQAFDLVVSQSPIPWLHIAEAVGREANARGFHRLGVLGTRSLMEGPVYPETLKPYGIASHIPAADDRAQINRIILKNWLMAPFWSRRAPISTR